jgi:hypothetical protein
VTHSSREADDDSPAKAVAVDAPLDNRGDDQAGRNFFILALYQVIVRVGWIFKTESIVMPAVLDSIAGAGWVRGWLPLLNRIGHSIPPLLLARRVTMLPYKARALFATTTLMSLCFLSLSAMFYGRAWMPVSWMPLLFLGLYAAFFMCVGVNQLSFGTLQGKLVPPVRRGRLLSVSTTVGSVAAILCALILMPRWLRESPPRFDLVFGIAGLLFALAALTLLGLVESQDRYRPCAERFWGHFSRAFKTFRDDATFRTLALSGAMFSSSIMLFPHYQNLGLSQMGLEVTNLVWWVVVQNLGTGLFSIPAGVIADRWGNRLVLQFALLGIAAAPTLAIGLMHLGPAARWAYPLVFVLIGLTPVVFRSLD